MKLMHSLPQQISITHTNGPHFRPRRKKGKTAYAKKNTATQQERKKKKKDNESVGALTESLYDERCLLEVLIAGAA